MVYLISIFWHGVCMYQRNVNLYFLLWYCQQPESKGSSLVPSDTSHLWRKDRWVWPSWVTSLQTELLSFENLLTPNPALILSHFLVKLVTVSQWGNRVWQSFPLASFIFLEPTSKYAQGAGERRQTFSTSLLFFSQRMTEGTNLRNMFHILSFPRSSHTHVHTGTRHNLCCSGDFHVLKKYKLNNN